MMIFSYVIGIWYCFGVLACFLLFGNKKGGMDYGIH